MTYRRRGYCLLARNWRCRLGELDLVVARAGEVVFCEVKARTSTSLAAPHESVTEAKRRKLRTLAAAFIAARAPVAERFRFDVASVVVRSDGEANVHIFEDAF
jgi:putative endonuclease